MEDFPYTPEKATEKLNRYLTNAGLVGRFAPRLNENEELEFIKNRGTELVIYSAQAALGLIVVADTMKKKIGEVIVYESPELTGRNKNSKRKVPRGPGRYSKPVS